MIGIFLILFQGFNKQEIFHAVILKTKTMYVPLLFLVVTLASCKNAHEFCNFINRKTWFIIKNTNTWTLQSWVRKKGAIMYNINYHLFNYYWEVRNFFKSGEENLDRLLIFFLWTFCLKRHTCIVKNIILSSFC